MSSVSFSDLGASAPTIKALAARGIERPFPIQTMVIKDAIAGRDVLAKSRTGSGKTLAFAIPIIERIDRSLGQPSALILVPTRELAVQVTEEFEAIAHSKGLRVAAAYGGVSLYEQGQRAKKSHVLVATPGRLEDFAQRKVIDLSKVAILVLDEADRMLDMGFQPQVDRIVRRLSKVRQTMFFSATLDGEVGRLAKSYTSNPAHHEVASPSMTIEEIDHRFIPIDDGDKVGALIRLLAEERGLTLIFVRTKRGADRLASKLKAAGIKSAAMHGDMTQSARQNALVRFETGKVTTLVATDVAARGLDIDDITHVINYDAPEDHKAYLHRVGRTARAGKSGSGITLVATVDRADVGRMASHLDLKAEFEGAGLSIPKPQLTFTSHRGRNSIMGRRPRSRGVRR